MKIINGSNKFNYQLEDIEEFYEEEKRINGYRFELNLNVIDKFYNMIIEFDIGNKSIYSIYVANQEGMNRDDIDNGYMYLMMLKEELTKHMKYILNL